VSGSRARAIGHDAGDGADTKVLSCLLLSRVTDLFLPSRINVRNLYGLRPILHRLWDRHVRDICNLRAVFPADTRAGNRIEDNVADQVDRLAISTDMQSLLRFGVSATF